MKAWIARRVQFPLLFLILTTFSVFGLQSVDRLVAVVNDEPVSAQELAKKSQMIEKKRAAMGQTKLSKDALAKEALNSLITERLELQRADQEGIQVDDASLDEALTRMAQQNQLTLDQFKEVVAKEGFSFSEYREDIRRQMKISRLEQRALSGQIKVSDQEIKTALAQLKMPAPSEVRYQVFHVVIDKSLSDAESRAAEIAKLIKKEENMQALAESEEEAVRAQLFVEKKENLPSVIAKEVTRMKTGEIRGPVFTDGGVHIIKLLDKSGDLAKHEIQETEVRHILIKKQASLSDAAIQAKLKDLANQIKHGKSFGDLAKVHSDDPESGQNGGSLGWVSAGQFVPPFEKAMNELAPNQLSAPIQTPYGWHLIQVTNRRTRDDTQAYLKQKAKEHLYGMKFEEARIGFVKRLRDEAFVEVL